jgi:hypothetical protein
MVGLGAATFLTAQQSLPVWAKWLFGPMLWYFGFALLVVWGLYRIFGIGKLHADETEPEIRETDKIKIFPSNFLEHDYEHVIEPVAKRSISAV